MKKKIGKLLRRSKSKPDLGSVSASSSSNDKPYAECVVNRAALALDERQDVESRASGSDAQRMGAASGGGADHSQHNGVSPNLSGGYMNSNMSVGSGGPGGGPGSHHSASGQSSGGGYAPHGSNSSMYGGSSSNQSTYGGAYTVAASVVSGLSGMDQSAGGIDSRKLVIQYFLQDAEETYADDGRRKTLGAGMAVKVKARVENAPLTLEENLQIQLEEDRRAMSGRDPRGDRYQPRLGGFVHCVAPPSSNIDASDAIGLVSNYVVAYRALHRTCDRPLRRHDKVLITNAHGSLGRSLVELALMSGASVVFGTAPPKYHERLSKWGATPLDADDSNGPDGWSELLLGSVDVVIDTDAGDACDSAPLVANQATGKLVRILTGPNAGGDVKIWRKKNSLMDQPVSTTFYDVFHDMEEDPSGFRSDLQLLFDMMYGGSIRPRKKKAIPLLGVSYIELRFDRAPYHNSQRGDAASSSSRHKRSKSTGSTRSNGRGSRSQSTSRARQAMEMAAESSPEPQQHHQHQAHQQHNYVERRSQSAPRTSGRGWDDAADEIARAARSKQQQEHKRSSSRGSTRSNRSGSKSRSRSGSRHRREEDEIARKSRQRLAAEQQHDDRLALRQKSSSFSSGRKSSSRSKERSKSAPRVRDDGRRDERDRRSRSAPRDGGGRGESSGDDLVSRSSSRRKMKSGRTDRSKSAPRERWNDENDGGVGNDRYDDRNDSPKSYRSRETTSRAARVFDFSFW